MPAVVTPEDDCQYSDINGTAVHAPTIANIYANLTPKHWLYATLTLVAAMVTSSAATYYVLTSGSPLFASLTSPFHVLAYSSASTSFQSFHYHYSSASTIAQTQNTNDTTLPALLPTPTLALIATPDPDRDTPDCWTPELYDDYLSGELYAQFFNQRRLWGNPLYTLSDVLVLVTTAGRYHRTRADVLMCTWVQELPPGHVIFVSDSDDDQHLLPVVNVMKDQPQPQLSHTFVDSSRLAPLGWKAAYDIGRQLGVSWYYRIDDDTFIAPNNLVRVMNQYNHSQPIMLGQRCDLQPSSTKPTGIQRFCGGGGELLSASLLNVAAPFLFTECDPHNGDTHDVFLPRCIADRIQVEPTDRIEFNSQWPEWYYRTAQGVVDRVDGFGKVVSFHYVRPWQMYMWLYKLYVAFQS